MKKSHTAAQAQAHDAGLPAATDSPAGEPRREDGEALEVRTAVTAGGVRFNHSEALAVRSDVRAGALTFNHSEALVVRSDVRAGVAPIGANHSEAVALVGEMPA